MSITHKALQQSARPVEAERRLSDGTRCCDFGAAAFATLEMRVPEPPREAVPMVVHLGEKLAADGRIDREPGGSVRYRPVRLTLEPGRSRYRLEIPPDARNTGPQAIPMPPEIGEVLPFRYAELEGLPEGLAVEAAQLMAHYPFDDEAASFRADNAVLNDVWELCRYTIKATTFCGLYVDGDRERIPYEADAYLNQLSHYCVDREYGMARATLEHFVEHPTWPTEWQFQFIFMAWTEYLYTGDDSFLREHYQTLKTRLLMPLARADGLLDTSEVPARLLEKLRLGKLCDIVDWPPAQSFGGDSAGERDGYDMRPVNTVVNAFYLQALRLMARIARQLGHDDDRSTFVLESQKVQWGMHSVLIDLDRGIYRDGEQSEHHALHANMLPLAFGIAAPQQHDSLVAFIRSRGMACSVYGAQFLLDGLFRAGADDYALELLTATHDRSWAHMLYTLGSTMTLEAWDPRYKPNLDWNHAWGAAPANLLPRWILGVQPIQPGCERVRIQPHLGTLQWAKGRVPLPQGTVEVEAERDGERLALSIEVPDGVAADVYLPGQRKPDRVEGGRHAFRQ